MNAIETKDLVKAYRGHIVLDKVNLVVPEGSVFGFVGENGAGKTTVMRVISGLAEPTSGEYSIFGVNNKSSKIYSERKKTSAIVETTSLIPTMTAKQNLTFACLYLGIKEKPNFDEILAQVGLKDVGNKKAKNYSLGMKQRLGIALAMLNKPKLLLLDEPMNGLDPEGIAELRDLLIQLNKQGMTILISSHILSELEKISTHYGIISHGRLLKTITIDELRDRCRKGIDVSVDNPINTMRAFKEMKINDYKQTSPFTFKVFDNIKIVDLVTGLSKANVDIKALESKDESVEEYYLSLIKEEN